MIDKFQVAGCRLKRHIRLKIEDLRFDLRPSTFDLRPFCFLLLASFFSLTACTPLFVPPVRSSLEAPEILDLAGSQGLRRRGERLELSLQLNNVPEEGWLAVQWYSPDNALLASDSQWIESEDEGFARTYALPGDTEVVAGDWRVVVSFEDGFIRQFGLTIEE